MAAANKPDHEQAVRALHGLLSDYWFGRRIAWMHGQYGTEFEQGRASALTGLVLIPEVAATLEALDEEVGDQLKVVSNLKQWHETFEAK